MSGRIRAWTATFVAGGSLAVACGTPPPAGEQLPPVAIRSPLGDEALVVEDESSDVFVDRRSSTWDNDQAVAAGVDDNDPPEAARDLVVVPATTVPIPVRPRPRPVVVAVEPPAPTVPPAGPVNPATPTAGGTNGTPAPVGPGVVPSWPPYTTRAGLTDVAALTGWIAPPEITTAPILAVKIDNIRQARPQWALERADVVFEENIEAATRFLALFHSDVPDEVGPIRSARTTDIDLLTAMNRPILAWSGGNPGVTEWVDAASDAGLVNDVAAVRSNCYRRDSSRRSPNNLIASTPCVIQRGAGAGPAISLWTINAGWTPRAPGTAADTSFEIKMDGLRVGWSWDEAHQVYVRSQNDQPHVTMSGARIAAENVVVLNVSHTPSVVDGRSPHAATVGTGTAVVHRDGMAISATWSRASAYHPFEFVGDDGSGIPLQVGRTFVEIARDA